MESGVGTLRPARRPGPAARPPRPRHPECDRHRALATEAL